MNWRTIALWIAVIIAASDVLIIVVYYFFPNFMNMKTLAEKFTWNITEFWLETTFWASLALLAGTVPLFWISLSGEMLIVLSIISFGWSTTLFLHHLRERDLTKSADAWKWLIFGISLVIINLSDWLTIF